jgi:hypothetical protein
VLEDREGLGVSGQPVFDRDVDLVEVLVVVVQDFRQVAMRLRDELSHLGIPYLRAGCE